MFAMGEPRAMKSSSSSLKEFSEFSVVLVFLFGLSLSAEVGEGLLSLLSGRKFSAAGAPSVAFIIRRSHWKRDE